MISYSELTTKQISFFYKYSVGSQVLTAFYSDYRSFNYLRIRKYIAKLSELAKLSNPFQDGLYYDIVLYLSELAKLSNLKLP